MKCLKKWTNKLIIYYRTLSIGVKASLWFIVCNVAQRGIALITLPIFTRLLSTQQYGLVSVFSSWESIVSIFLTLNLSAGVFVTAYVKFEEDKNRVMSSFLGLSSTVTCIGFLFSLLFKNSISHFMEMPFEIVVLLFLQVLVTPALSLWSLEQKFEYKYKLLIAVTMAISVLTPLLGIIFVHFSSEKGVAKICSAVLVQLIFCGACYAYIIKRGKLFFDATYWKYAITFALPLLPHYLSLSILAQSDRIMISKYVGQDKAAIYSIAYSAASIISLFLSGINNSFGPWSVKKIKQKEYDSVSQKIEIILPGIVVIILMLLCFEPEIISIFATKEYYEAIWVMPPITLGLYFTFINSIFLRVEFYYEMKYLIAISSCVAAGLNIVLNAIFIPIFGYYAAGYTTMICYMLLTICHYFVMRYIAKKYMQRENLFNIKYIVKITGWVFRIGAMVLPLYNYTVIRYCILMVVVMVLVVKREKVFEYFRSIR